MALTSIKWRLDRPFIFFENGCITGELQFSVYHDLPTADSPQGLTTNGTHARSRHHQSQLFDSSLSTGHQASGSTSITTISAECADGLHGADRDGTGGQSCCIRA